MNRFALLLSLLAILAPRAMAQSAAERGQEVFERSCGVCHGGDGLGGEMAPTLARQARLDDDELSKLIHDGIPARGMPAFTSIAAKDKSDLMTFIRTIRMMQRPAPVSRTVEMMDGKKMTGLVLNESPSDMQLRTGDGRVHVLRTESGKFREATSQADWTTYNGSLTGNRFSTLNQITKQNVSKLAPKWIATMEGTTSHSETTPIVVQGIMYVTSANECWALDAGSGRLIWHFQRQRTQGLIGNAAQGINRGVAWLGDSVFMVTDNAHLLALNRFNGDVQWETIMADWKQNYNATAAPLVADNLVISGTAGGEQGARGFVAAFDPKDGKEVWRFWTVPKPGEPGSETWSGKAIEHPSAVTWMSGSFDAELDMLYWASGNPGPDFSGAEREGDNLYSDCILALDPKTGKMKWYYQTTPHDVHDWDAQEPMVLVDSDWEGKPRKLLLQANRNGFFYVLDRGTGELLRGKPFVQKMNWAKELDSKGKPIPLTLPTGSGPDTTLVCPNIVGASNWYSSAYDPASGYYYVQTIEGCTLYSTKAGQEWEAGKGYSGGSQRNVPNEASHEILRAFDVKTGKVVWEFPQYGFGSSYGGVLGFANGVLIVCGDDGILSALDSTNGKLLWQFQTNVTFKSSPMTYVFDGKQYIAISVGQNILAFGLPDLPQSERKLVESMKQP
jgi:alcohol dehydrogenase (cytochrome c)